MRRELHRKGVHGAPDETGRCTALAAPLFREKCEAAVQHMPKSLRNANDTL